MKGTSSPCFLLSAARIKCAKNLLYVHRLATNKTLVHYDDNKETGKQCVMFLNEATATK